MALKDWHKNKGNYWNKRTLHSIHITPLKQGVSVEVWHDLGWTTAGRDYAHDFKAKTSATKFVKTYMRRH